MKKIAPLIIGLCLVLSGCRLADKLSPAEDAQSNPADIVRLTAVGYGATSAFDGYSPGQKRLMAMRASKLDAYRSLAEQIHGFRITGNTTVAAMMVKSDSFRVYIDAHIRGARVQTVTPMSDGNYETVIEVDFDQKQARSVIARTILPPPADSKAPLPADAKASSPAEMKTPVPADAPKILPQEPVKGMTGSGEKYDSSFYYAE